MKQFFYRHYRIAKQLTVAWLLIPIFITTVIACGIANRDRESALILPIFISGYILALLLAVIYTALLGAVEKTLQELERLRMGRACFHTSAQETRAEAETRIRRNLEKGRMKPVVGLSEFPDRLGLWHRTISLDQRKIRLDGATKQSNSYFLYSVPVLDETKWNELYGDLCECMEKQRTLMRESGKFAVVFAVCVLADQVDPDIALKMQSPQSFVLNEKVTVHGVRVCVAAVPQNRWYVAAEKADDLMLRSEASRQLVGKMTFGASLDGFPYKGNTEYTKAYLSLWDEVSGMTFSELCKRNKEQKAKEDECPSDRIYATMQDGDICRDGDTLYCLVGKKQVEVYLYLPEEAEKELSGDDEEEEDDADLEDLLSADEEDDDPAEQTVPPDYRGEIVATVPTISLKPHFVSLNRATQKAICSSVEAYLLAQGFAGVSFWNSDTKKIAPLSPDRE